mmetsp:Transcript_41010/g.89612  ORF Transcript_41010/g.89612 Transcript_41010/m.89612 type:complete len:457 (-) Transcript_41010:30-1400(-)
MRSDQGVSRVPSLPRSKSFLPSWRSGRRVRRLQSLLLTGAPDDSGSEATWWMVALVLVPQYAGLALVVPVLPRLKLQFFGGDSGKAARVQSLMESTRAILTFCVTSDLGKLADAVGRRPLVILSVLCTLGPLLSLVLTSNLYPYFALFTLAGAMGGQSSPAVSAYVADCVPNQDRAQTFGIIGALVGGSLMVAPLLGSYIADGFGMTELFRLAVAIEVLAALIACVIPESLPESRRTPFFLSALSLKKAQPLLDLFETGGANLYSLALFRVFQSIAGKGLSTVTFFALAQLVSFNDVDFGVLIILYGATGILGQSVLLRMLMRCGCKEMTLLMLGQFATAAQAGGFLLLGPFPSKALVFALLAFAPLSAVADPAFTAALTKGFGEDLGFVLGVFNAIDGFTSFLAPFVFSLLFSVNPFYPFAVGCALHLAAVGPVVAMLRQPSVLDEDSESPASSP